MAGVVHYDEAALRARWHELAKRFSPRDLLDLERLDALNPDERDALDEFRRLQFLLGESSAIPTS